MSSLISQQILGERSFIIVDRVGANSYQFLEVTFVGQSEFEVGHDDYMRVVMKREIERVQ